MEIIDAHLRTLVVPFETIISVNISSLSIAENVLKFMESNKEILSNIKI